MICPEDDARYDAVSMFLALATMDEVLEPDQSPEALLHLSPATVTRDFGGTLIVDVRPEVKMKAVLRAFRRVDETYVLDNTKAMPAERVRYILRDMAKLAGFDGE